MIDGKATLLSDLFCDGLGACIGHCPLGAIEIEEREAEKYSEKTVMENIIKGGENVIIAHLLHLKDHGEEGFLKDAIEFLRERNMYNDKIKDFEKNKQESKHHEGCPGSRMMDFSSKTDSSSEEGLRGSHLRQWPVQLHLVPVNAPYFRGADLLLCADCVAYSLGDFHKDYLKGKSLAIACPKLDSDREIYVDNIRGLIEDAKINTLTVMIMEVPCCSGLLKIALDSLNLSSRKIPVKVVVVGIKGDIIKEEWAKI